MKTYTAKPADVQREWHLIDADGQTLGRLSTRAARLLMGKHKPIYTPSQDTGDFVVIINAEKVRFTGRKATQKLYYRHSGYPGGFKSIWLGKMMQQHPTRAIEHAIKGMLPRTRLGAVMNSRLKVYAGGAHPHQSQVNAGAANEKEQ
jgi:large subunit ribosomal protein L13